MANTLKFGNGQWATKVGSTLAYNDEGGNFKPLPFNFTRSTSATRVNKDGLIEMVTNNKPRIDFLNDSNGALLLEPSRTNVALYSEDFSNASWVKQNINLTSNYELSPSGLLNADRVISTNTGVDLYQNISVSANTTYTFTFYAKLRDGENIQARFYDLSNSANISYVNYSSQLSNNEWKRVEIEVTTPLGCTSLRVWVVALTSTLIDVSYWGAMLEQGSYATSYIPTQGATATRVDEVCNRAGNSQIFNDSEGVLYFEVLSLANNAGFRNITLSSSTQDNRIQFYFRPDANQVTFLIQSGGATVNFATLTLSDALVFNKFAILWDNGTYLIYINGVLQTTLTYPSPIGLDRIIFSEVAGGNKFYGECKDLRVYSTALTDTDLINLTKI